MMINRAVLVFLAYAAIAACWHDALSSAHAQWPQWGGPSRDFTVKSDKLADTWPKDGPPRLWSRPLGDGYSSIISDGDLIFTMYRPDRTADFASVPQLACSLPVSLRVRSHDNMGSAPRSGATATAA